MFSFDRPKYPDLPGVYIMKDANDTIIYVGKATSLRDRLSQYFHAPDREKTSILVSNIVSIEFIITKTANEALILESNLIKTNQPKFNMVLKDAKHYAYLALTDERFPRLLVARKNSSGKFRFKAKRLFGPFVEGAKRAISARYLRRLFRIRICKELPKKECLQYHIGNCDAPCIGKITIDEYQKNIESLSAVLEGKGEAKRVMSELADRMKGSSDNQDYEKAAMIRDQIESLKIFFERQRVEKVRRVDEDFVWFTRIGGTLHVQILRSQNGVIGRTEKHSMTIKEQEDPERSFFLQYFSDSIESHEFRGSRELPDKIYANISANDRDALNNAMKTDAFTQPSKEKEKVLEIAEESLEYGEIDGSVMKLKERLQLEANPLIIETFDISTLFGEETVASMVRFVNGLPDKAGYRRFKIKSLVPGTQDDFSSMKEVVRRRYSRLKTENSPMPDLVLIDGGAGQLHAAVEGMDQAGIRLPIASIAKREEEIYLPNRMDTLKMPRSDPALKLLQQCRDEAHRFAINYHRLRKRKKLGEDRYRPK